MPESAQPQGGTPTPTPISEIDWNGNKYKVDEVVRGYEEFKKLPQEDVQNLGKYKEAASAYSELAALMEEVPSLKEAYRNEYAKKQGFIPMPKPGEQPANGQPNPAPAPQAQGSQLPKEVVEAINRLTGSQTEAMQKLQRLEEVQGNVEMNSQMDEALKSFPFWENKSEKVIEAAQAYCHQQASAIAAKGGNYDNAYVTISNNLAALPIREWAPIVAKQEYHKWLLGQQPGGGSIDPKVNTAAETIGGGQPGPTPEVRDQLKKEYRAALNRGASQEELASIWLKYSNKSGGSPVQELGLDASLARELARK